MRKVWKGPWSSLYSDVASGSMQIKPEISAFKYSDIIQIDLSKHVPFEVLGCRAKNNLVGMWMIGPLY